MRAFAALLACLAVVGGCGEEDNKQAPDTAIDTQPPALTNVAQSMFSFRAIGVSNNFICEIDGGGPSTCQPPVSVELADGEHTFTVAAALNANVDETPATYTWRIDTVAPATVLLTSPPVLDNDTTPEFTFEGTDPEGAVTFECAVDGAAAAPCTSPFGVTIGAGVHTFAVTAVDAAGNRDGSPATHDWTVDTATPDTAIDAGPTNGSTSPANVTFAFSSPDATATFECAADGATFVACTSPLALNTLTDGNHDFAVRAVGVGGADPSPAARAWTVDALAPEVTITTSPANPSNDATPDFAFSSTDVTATFECQVDGVVAFAACTSPFASPALADGNRTFRVRALDAVGNFTEATFAWLVDTIAPTVALTAEPSSASSDSTPTVAFTIAGSPVTTTCGVDAEPAVACTSPFTIATADGTHTITVTVTDAAGNASSASTAAFVIDTVSPTVTITTEPTAVSSDSSPTVAFTVTDAPTVVSCQLDVQAPVACTSPHTFATAGDGNHTITVRVADPVGNAGIATTAVFAIDTVAPTVSITTAPTALSNDTTPSVAFTTAGNPTAVTCQLDAQAAVDCTSPFVFGITADGAHTITVRVADGAGNSSTDVTPSFTIDTLAPTVVIDTEPAALSNDTTPTVTFTTAGAPTLTQCRVDTGTFVNCAGGTFTPAVGNGAHTITVRVTDGATNSATATTASFTVDTVPPTVVINTEPAVLSNDATPTLTFTTGGVPTSTQCQVDAGTLVDCSGGTFSPAVLDGNHTLTVRVTDGAGNTASATSTPFTVDTAAPTVAIDSQPAALSNDTTPIVAFTTGGAPTTTQCQVDAGTLVTCAGSFTPTVAAGTHTITVRVADAAGNTASATTAPFVVDITPPTIVIDTQPVALSTDTTPTVTFTTGGGPTSTQCQVDAGTLVTCAGTFTPTVTDGAHTITIRVADAAGNTASATTSTFTVDTVAPTVVINTQPAAISRDSTPTVTFTTGGAPTSTQCQVDTGTLVTCAGSFTPTVLDGAHTITVRVADGAGNTTSATTSTFTVDTIVPTVTITTEPPANSNDDTPAVVFTTTDSPSIIQCRVDTGAFATCASPFTAAAQLDGNHTITVRVADAAGNASTDTTAVFAIDTVAPTVVIDTQPAAISSDDTPTVTFTTGGAPTSTQCQVDAGTLVTCAGSFTPTVADGAHTITVRVADGAGNTASATTASFTVDTVTPAVTITTEPAANSNDDTPTVVFSTTDSPSVIECRVDTGAFAPCTSPFTATAQLDGDHTITVRVADAAGNASTATTADFTIDTSAPDVAFVDVPPDLWPVNYFDVVFESSETVTFTCRLDAGAPAPCTSPFPVRNVSYAGHTVTVTARDAAGNTSPISTSWTSQAGLVLHYPWEQGSTANTSLLRQNAAYSPDGPGQGPFVGGWAGTALGSQSGVGGLVFPRTAEALSSSPGDVYTASFWLRTFSDSASGIVFSTLDVDGGIEVTMQDVTMTVRVRDSGQEFESQFPLAFEQWTHVALRTTGRTKGLEVWLNGNFVRVFPTLVEAGFGARQNKDLRIGPFEGVDLDDLRFHNVAFADAEICTRAARGTLGPQQTCIPLAPGFEFDFEDNRVLDTGAWQLGLIPPQDVQFFRFGNTGNALRLASVTDWAVLGFAAQAQLAPGHSFSLWFNANTSTIGPLIDFTRPCNAGTCGISVNWSDNGQIDVFVGSDLGVQTSVSVPLDEFFMNNIVVTEQREGNKTLSISIYVNGKSPVVVGVPAGDVFSQTSDSVRLPSAPFMIFDEIEFWTEDLSKDPEMLCENGFDGEFDPVDGTCALTSNPSGEL